MHQTLKHNNVSNAFDIMSAKNIYIELIGIIASRFYYTIFSTCTCLLNIQFKFKIQNKTFNKKWMKNNKNI